MISVKSHEGTITEIEIGESLSEEDYDSFERRLEEKINKSGKVNILCRMDQVPDMSSDAIKRDLKLFSEHYDSFEKMAIVSDDENVALLTKMGDILPGLNIEYFKTRQEDEAWKWLKE